MRDAIVFDLKSIIDARGQLLVVDPLPFEARRMFMLRQEKTGAARGGHAHRTLKQLLCCVTGYVSVRSHDLSGKVLSFTLFSPDQAFYAPPMTWVEVVLHPYAVLVVLASDVYREEDYISDKQAFMGLR